MYSVVIEQTVVSGSDVTLMVSTSSNPDAVVLTADECKIFWDEFKTHPFRRENHTGEMAHKIFMKMEKIANAEDYNGEGYHSERI